MTDERAIFSMSSWCLTSSAFIFAFSAVVRSAPAALFAYNSDIASFFLIVSRSLKLTPSLADALALGDIASLVAKASVEGTAAAISEVLNPYKTKVVH